jgi:hypothetical protein
MASPIFLSSIQPPNMPVKQDQRPPGRWQIAPGPVCWYLVIPEPIIFLAIFGNAKMG